VEVEVEEALFKRFPLVALVVVEQVVNNLQIPP